MHLTCHCLNVSLKIIAESAERLNDMIVKPETLQLSEDAFDDLFFSEAGHTLAMVMVKDENAITERLPMLIRKRNLDNWEVRKCLLCNIYTYATNYSTPGRILVSLKLLSDDCTIAERRKCADFSPAFQVVLPKKNSVAPLVDTYTAGNGSGLLSGASNTVSRYALHVIQDMLAQCLKREQQAVEERIQKYADEQQAAFEQFKSNAKSQRITLLSLLAHNQATDMQAYFDDDENDSAVPLSPLSLRSGDPSPAALVGFPNATTTGSQFYDYVSSDNSNLQRPKAMSNPACLSSWKRKRHSGGSGKAPTLTSYPEEQQDIFNFEENENYPLTADDEDDTDDSGTSISDYSKYYPSMSDYRYAQHHENDSYFYNSDKTVSQFGKSLPLTIVTPSTQMQLSCAPMTTRTYKSKQRFTVNDDELEDHHASGLAGVVDNHIGQRDLGASMLALAQSIQAEDDPERLFGERPHRRRYKTDGGHGTRLASSSRCAVTTTADRRPSAF